MSDLVERLREWWEYDIGHLIPKAADRIEQLEWELAAEKAMSDRLYDLVKYFEEYAGDDYVTKETYPERLIYRKARGL